MKKCNAVLWVWLLKYTEMQLFEIGMDNVKHLTVPEQNRIRSTEFLDSLESVTRYILFSTTLQAYRHVSNLFIIHRQNNVCQ